MSRLASAYVSISVNNSGLAASLNASRAMIQNAFSGIQISGNVFDVNQLTAGWGIFGNVVRMGFAAFSGNWFAFAMEGAQAIMKVADAFKDFIVQTTVAAGEFERLEVSLKLLLGDAEGTKAFTWIKEFTAETDFSIKTTGKLLRQFSGLGFSVERSTRLVKNMASVIATVGGDDNDLTAAGRAIFQMFGKGKVQSEELVRQLANAYPNAIGAISQAMGMTNKQLFAGLKGGNIKPEQIEQAMNKIGESDKFSGALETMAMTWTGAWNNMKDVVWQAMAEIGRPIIEALKPIVLAFGDAFNPKEASGGLRAIGSGIALLLTPLQLLVPLAQLLGATLRNLSILAKDSGKGWEVFWLQIKIGAASAVQWMAGPFIALVAATAGATAASLSLFMSWWNNVKQIFSNVKQIFSALWEAFEAAVAAAAPGGESPAEAFKRVFSEKSTNLLGGGMNMQEVFKKAGTVGQGAFNDTKKKLEDIFDITGMKKRRDELWKELGKGDPKWPWLALEGKTGDQMNIQGDVDHHGKIEIGKVGLKELYDKIQEQLSPSKKDKKEQLAEENNRLQKQGNEELRQIRNRMGAPQPAILG